jgi:uncharacterized protein
MPPFGARRGWIMADMKAFVTRHPVASYFALTVAISWGGVLFVITRPDAMSSVGALDNPLFPFAALAMLAGPSLTGLLLTGLIDGRAGLRQMAARLGTWRVGARWFAVALLTAPLLAFVIAVALSSTSPEFFPGFLVTRNPGAVVTLGLGVGLTAGFFEELGWTGFAVPKLMAQQSVRATGLIVGVLWSAWQLLVVIWGIGDRAGTIPLAVFVTVESLGTLPAFRVLMVSVYDRTESLLLVVLMHSSLTASTLILTPRTIGVPLLLYGLAFTAAVWGIVAVIGRLDWKHLLDSRRLDRAA